MLEYTEVRKMGPRLQEIEARTGRRVWSLFTGRGLRCPCSPGNTVWTEGPEVPGLEL